MAWIIRKMSNEAFADGQFFVVQNRDEVRARIGYVKGTWMVTFHDAPALDWQVSTAPTEDGLERCIGYVRGIERATQVHAAETRPQRTPRPRGGVRRRERFG